MELYGEGEGSHDGDGRCSTDAHFVNGVPGIARGVERVISGLVGEEELVEDVQGAASVGDGDKGHGSVLFVFTSFAFFYFAKSVVDICTSWCLL